MSDEATFILELAAVVGLSSYLYLRHCRGMRPLFEPRHPAAWTGQAIEVEKLKPAVDTVRHDYLVGRSSSKGAGYHRALLCFTRHAVTQLAYFHDRPPQEPTEAGAGR